MSNETYRAKIELVTSSDIEEFVALCNQVEDHEFALKGFDEKGKPWQMNAKSMIGTAALAAIVNEQKRITERDKEKAEMRGIVDWNTIYVESTYPFLHTLLGKFTR